MVEMTILSESVLCVLDYKFSILTIYLLSSVTGTYLPNSADADSEDDSIDDSDTKFGDACIARWSSRKIKLEHDLPRIRRGSHSQTSV